MKAVSLKSFAFAAVLALCAAPVFAATDDGADDTAPEILQTQHALRAKLDNPTGEYRNFSRDSIARMKEAQDRVFRMLDGRASLDELNKDEKIALSNDLDQIKHLLANNEGGRLICHTERKTGSNLAQRVCMTSAEREAQYQQTQRDLQHANNRLDGM